MNIENIIETIQSLAEELEGLETGKAAAAIKHLTAAAEILDMIQDEETLLDEINKKYR